MITHDSSPRTLLPCLLLTVATVLLGTGTSSGRDLTFEERVAAREAIERVYYSHQIGATKLFEEAVPREAIERKILNDLEESVTLEKRWRTPVTAEMLQREWERVALHTRLPGRLEEIYRVLHDDPVLIRETFIRPLLVERLARNFFSHDRQIHADTRFAAEDLRSQLITGQLDFRQEDSRRSVVEVGRIRPLDDRLTHAIAPAVGPQGRLRESPLETPPDEYRDSSTCKSMEVGRFGPVVEETDVFRISVTLAEDSDGSRVADYLIPKETWDTWWDRERREISRDELDAVGREAEVAGITMVPPAAGKGGDVPADSWDNGALDDLPEQRFGHTAVWTGSEMLVWGGELSDSTFLDTGGRYDPATDTWSSISLSMAPSARRGHTAVWADSVMLVWGGYDGQFENSGGRYNPRTNAWEPMDTVMAPSGRSGHASVWTGKEMLVWGGSAETYLTSGGRYDPRTDQWTPLSQAGAPAGAESSTSVWTGKEMIVWGGFNGTYPRTGGRYDPRRDRWTPTTISGAPSGRSLHSAIWTGRELVVWGGAGANGLGLNSGGRYEPNSDTWSPTALQGAPSGRGSHTAAWTGKRMLVWGGDPTPRTAGVDIQNTGARYDPRLDTWTPLSLTTAPAPRSRHTAIWTGKQMVIWGGIGDLFSFNTGGRYDPDEDLWTPTSTLNGPTPRRLFTAVWTGNFMMIWGGLSRSYPELAGARYDLLTDSWSPISTQGAPVGRVHHVAVWTGTEMIVWGGDDQRNGLRDGGRYNPLSDSWRPTSMTGEPGPDGWQTAVWSGKEMIVWGDGRNGRYDPDSDSWRPVSSFNAPSLRYAHTVVWTGHVMIVWGGSTALSITNTGGRYDPSSDSWKSTTLVGAPTARQSYTAIWSGSEMLIWGGEEQGMLNSGGRYDPETDSWRPTSTLGVPLSRRNHTAVWTGQEMIIWGGYHSPYSPGGPALNTGGRYEPDTDSWIPVSVSGAPLRRHEHTATWTGDFMLVWGGMTEASFSLRPPPLAAGGRYAPYGLEETSPSGMLRAPDPRNSASPCRPCLSR